ncbi:tubulin--tyrosine ligase-like protein 12 [Centruroides sculpturatus]|uniref:tubulin--tyrosine ligase-like protein 12 n=1 Tax=Centruroides sculpturatus TaxID=218467 RepID=UPI000C6E79AD|nr:tubulin--tyrosine ligase-like protein 12 [Centruroides sculpturatus]
MYTGDGRNFYTSLPHEDYRRTHVIKLDDDYILYIYAIDEVTRNYIEGPPCDKLTQTALKIPWIFTDMTDIDCCPTEPNVDYFTSGRVQESLPDLEVAFPPIPNDKKLKVFSSYKVITYNLNHPRFEITSNEEEADILWYDYHFKEYRQLSQMHPHKFVNQFPFEHILTVKDLFASVCQRAADNVINAETLESSPQWLATTYNLKTELPKFVSYYQQRAKRGLDNYWICKPWNLARGLDMHITDNLNYILRLPSTGPKIACKYISDPVLFPRDDVGLVKFDIRYIILLRSTHPLRLYAYKHFWLRFANKLYSLDNFDDYEKHFTVMNYRPTVLQQMYCDKFIEKFELYYSQFKWSKIEEEIFAALKEVFESATSRTPPLGLAESPQSRAMYAVDLMLEWNQNDDKMSMHPVLLEINWAPDCNRACQYYPHFFDDVFSVLFLDDAEDRNVVLL